MIITKRLMGKAIATWLGPTGDAARRAATELRERVTGAPRTLALYLDIAEPWSYLAAQIASRLVAAYPIEIELHPVTPPASDVDAFPLQRAKHAVRDAKQLAEYWNLDFPGKREADSGAVRDVGTVLVRERPPRDQLAAALELTGAMWSGDKKALALGIGKWGSESHGAVPPILNSNYAELRKAGHYQGAMFRYGGQWYWGVDRLAYLEAALARDTGAPLAHVVTARPLAERGPLVIAEDPPPNKPKLPLACDLWFSFRSPYSYLALEQIEAVIAPYALPLVLRPVPPLAARGAVMPTVKRMYIVHDAKREADRLHIPFGELCEPSTRGVAHCIALAHWAAQRGAGDVLAFAKSAMRGIWAEARDVGEYVDLRFVVERAGLPWDEARAALADPEAPKWAAANTTDLAVFGLWGVPSVKVGDFITWGQDRLPLLADRLRRDALARAARDAGPRETA